MKHCEYVETLYLLLNAAGYRISDIHDMLVQWNVLKVRDCVDESKSYCCGLQDKYHRVHTIERLELSEETEKKTYQ